MPPPLEGRGRHDAAPGRRDGPGGGRRSHGKATREVGRRRLQGLERIDPAAQLPDLPHRPDEREPEPRDRDQQRAGGHPRLHTHPTPTVSDRRLAFNARSESSSRGPSRAIT